MQSLLRFIRTISESIYRREGETSMLDSSARVRPKYLLIGAFAVLVFSIFLPIFFNELTLWEGAQAQVGIPNTAWTVYYGQASGPQDGRIWNSPYRRADVQHAARRSALEGREFWLATEVPVSDLSQAYAREANHLVLGHIIGTHSLYIDGQKWIEGSWKGHEATIVPLPFERLQKAAPLKISIRIANDSGVNDPDRLVSRRDSGFSTKADAATYRRYLVGLSSVKPMGLFLLNAMLAIFLFFLWTTARQQQEYFYMAVYALLCAFQQMIRVDLVYLSLSRTMTNDLTLFARMYIGAFGFFLGLSFARAKGHFFKWGIPLALLAPFALRTYSALQHNQLQVNLWLDYVFVPACHFVGAFICVAQAYALYLKSAGSGAYRSRIQSLIYFALSLTLIAGTLLIEGNAKVSVLVSFVTFRFTHITLLMFLAVTAFLDFQRQRRIIDQTPITPYHHKLMAHGQGAVEETYPGFVLAIDLKNSEKLFRSGEASGYGGAFVQDCVSMMCASLGSFNGVLMQTTGDGLYAFFEQKVPHLEPVFKYIENITASLDEVSRHAAARNISLEFRAGLSYGRLKPIWQSVGKSRHPSWLEAAGTNPIIEATRLMDLEKTLGVPGSAVVFLRALIPQIFDARYKERHKLVGKHGVNYDVAVYRPAVPSQHSLHQESA